LNVLVVEPNESYRRLLVTLLGISGQSTVEAGTAAEAAERIASGKIDMVVTEWKLPDEGGLSVVQLVSQLRADGRKISGIVLTESAGREEVLAAVQAGADGFLLKRSLDPSRWAAAFAGSACRRREKGMGRPAVRSAQAAAPPPGHEEKPEARGPATGHAVNNGAASLRELRPVVTRSAILERIREISEVKAMSPTVTQITRLTANPATSLDAIAKVIARDQSVALKVLRLANSTLFERGDPVTSVRDAVLRIGTKNIRDLVLNLELIDSFSGVMISNRFNFMHFWEHSIACGLLAAEIGRLTGELDPDRAFTLGLLHDLGRMVLAEHFAPEYAHVLEVAERLDLPLELVEARLLLLNHADIMDRLLLMWSFPKDLVVPLASHHLSASNLREHAKKQLAESAILALSNRLAHAAMIGSSGNDTLYPTEALAQLLNLRGEDLQGALERAEKETDDVKFSLLMVGHSQPWTPVRERHRGRLITPINPLFASLRPGVDAVGVALDRLRDANAAPNVSVVHLASPAESVPAASRLRELEEAAGGARLPLLVISPTGELALPGEIARDRQSVGLPLPVTFAQLLRTLNRLCAAEEGAAGAQKEAA